MDAEPPFLPDAVAPGHGPFPSAPDWFEAERRTGRERYARVGLPTPRAEAWKYTPLRGLAGIVFEPAASAGDGGTPVADAGLLTVPGTRIVLVNGRLVPTGETVPAGVEVLSLAAAVTRWPDRLRPLLTGGADAPALEALNAAWLGDGVVVRITAGTVVETPIHLIALARAAATGQPLHCHPRIVILAEAGSRATLVESHLAPHAGRRAFARGSDDAAAVFTNVVGRVVVEDGARLDHIVATDAGPRATLVALTRATVGAGAVYDRFVLTTGGRLVRQELVVTLDGEGAGCVVNGAYVADGDRHVDNTTLIDHAVPRTTSRQVFKGVLDDAGRGVFQGLVRVRRNAQKTDGQQLHKALLLSRTAEVDTKPELEIFADDVKCSHGATAGELDEDALFYLRARGIDEDTARGLLIEAFLGDVIDRIAHPELRDAARAVVAAWLARSLDHRRQPGNGNTSP